MKCDTRKILTLAACGLAGTLATTASAQPYVINISGATLLRNLFEARASTNDFIDVDADGAITTGGAVDNVAFDFRDYTVPFATAPLGASSNHFWTVQYRSVGSINGILELCEWGGEGYGTSFGAAGKFATLAPVLPPPSGGQDRTLTLITSPVDRASAQGGTDRYISSSVLQGVARQTNPGAAPVRSTTDGLYQALDTTDVSGGIQVDLAPVDVPFQWGLARGTVAQASPLASANNPGYGRNTRQAVQKTGVAYPGGTAGTNNSLVDLNTSLVGVSINESRLYQTFIANAVVGALTNYGTGYEQITESNLNHSALTGRLKTGENLVQVTREIGSGTRNAYNNSLGHDPSFGVGENVGNDNASASNDQLGAGYLPSNKNGSGNMITTVINTRLGLGYTGAEQGVTGSQTFLTNGQMEVLAVQHDAQGGTQFSRPNIDEVIANDANGYRIQGSAVLMTIGDPRNQAELGGDPGNTNLRMRNPRAAAYINNITRSIEAFTALPGGGATAFTPGQFIAQNFVLTGALDFVQKAAITPTATDTRTWVPNTTVTPPVNLALRTFALGGAGTAGANSSIGRPAYYTFGLNSTGKGGVVPTRATGVYSDNNGGTHYRAFVNTNLLTYGTQLANLGGGLGLRNRIAYDFNGDGVRDINDAGQLVAAYRWRSGTNPGWTPSNGIYGAGSGNWFSPEMVGDGNCDGNFTIEDLRYFADGLALVGGSLDRKAGFTALDTAFGGNLFGTTLVTGAYSAGASRADIAGGAGVTRGHAPVGFDGTVNGTDIDYVFAQFKCNPGVTGDADWVKPGPLAEAAEEAAFFDLSADMNGDLKVNFEDVREILVNILGTTIGDVNLDGTTCFSDVDLALANLGGGCGANRPWTAGDVNGDGAVNDADIEQIVGAIPCPADLNCDGFVDDSDFVIFADRYDAFTAAPDRRGDLNADGFVDDTDFVIFAAAYDLFTCP